MTAFFGQSLAQEKYFVFAVRQRLNTLLQLLLQACVQLVLLLGMVQDILQLIFPGNC